MNIDAIKDVMKKQIAKPARAVVNSESSFVKYHLATNGFTDEAKAYWSYVCGGLRNGRFESEFLDPEFISLYKQLEDIDAKVSMPKWGTYGT